MSITEAVVTASAPSPRRRVKRKTWQTVIWFVGLLVLTAVVPVSYTHLTLPTKA